MEFLLPCNKKSEELSLKKTPETNRHLQALQCYTLRPVEEAFVLEYVKIMTPVSNALDILQGD
jgi:hypothetical protein